MVDKFDPEQVGFELGRGTRKLLDGARDLGATLKSSAAYSTRELILGANMTWEDIGSQIARTKASLGRQAPQVSHRLRSQKQQVAQKIPSFAELMQAPEDKTLLDKVKKAHAKHKRKAADRESDEMLEEFRQTAGYKGIVDAAQAFVSDFDQLYNIVHNARTDGIKGSMREKIEGYHDTLKRASKLLTIVAGSSEGNPSSADPAKPAKFFPDDLTGGYDQAGNAALGIRAQFQDVFQKMHVMCNNLDESVNGKGKGELKKLAPQLREHGEALIKAITAAIPPEELQEERFNALMRHGYATMKDAHHDSRLEAWVKKPVDRILFDYMVETKDKARPDIGSTKVKPAGGKKTERVAAQVGGGGMAIGGDVKPPNERRRYLDGDGT